MNVHLEFAPLAPSATDADVIILAGDISTGLNGRFIPGLVVEV